MCKTIRSRVCLPSREARPKQMNDAARPNSSPSPEDAKQRVVRIE